MHKDSEEKRLKQFYDDQFRIVEQYCKVYNMSPLEMLDQVFDATIEEIDEARRKEFVNKILWDPVALRILLIANTPTEDFQSRAKLYALSPPIDDHRYLCSLAILLHKEGWEPYLNDLAHDFMVNATIDLQKLRGRPGIISELRENHERVTKVGDGIAKWETDAWPKARVVQFVRIEGEKTKIEAHFYPFEKQTQFEFDNFIDEFMIGWMQHFHDKELRDDAYELQRRNAEVLINVYDVNGNLLKTFPFGLTEKYKPLIKRIARAYHFEPWEDIKAKTDETFFKAILKFSSEKGPPPGYFKLALIHSLSKEYREKIRKGDIFYIFRRENGETIEGIPKIEILKKEPESDFALIDQILKDLSNDPALKGNRNEIILESMRGGKSAQEIADTIKETSGESISRQAVQMWINRHINPKLRKRLELKNEMKEDQKRTRYDPMKRQKHDSDLIKRSHDKKGNRAVKK